MATNSWLEDESTLYEDETFLAYQGLVEQVLRSNEGEYPDGRPKGTTRGEIHKILGDKAEPKFTDMALEWTSHLISEGIPERFRIEERPMQTIAYSYSQTGKRKNNEKAQS